MMFSICWVFDGDRTLLTDSHAVIMRSFPASIPDFFQPGTEAVDTFLQIWHFESNWILPTVSQIARECVKRMGHLLFLCGSLRIFGFCHVTMVDIGTHLFMIGLHFPYLSNFLWEAKPRMTCLAQDSCPSYSSLCALVSSYLKGFLYQMFVLMTVAVAPSVAYVIIRVFCTH